MQSTSGSIILQNREHSRSTRITTVYDQVTESEPGEDVFKVGRLELVESGREYMVRHGQVLGVKLKLRLILLAYMTQDELNCIRRSGVDKVFEDRWSDGWDAFQVGLSGFFEVFVVALNFQRHSSLSILILQALEAIGPSSSNATSEA